jgi:REP-associated tyrosine transposase
MITHKLMYFHKNIRLEGSNYTGKRTYFVTQCCHERRKCFVDPARCEWLLSHVRCLSATHGFAVPAYCVMPDHVHLLVDGLAPTSDFLKFMKSLKIKTSREFAEESGTPLWQKKYFDHVLRPKESMDAMAWYIWLNPVRRGLARAPGLYPFAGSFTTKIPNCSTWPDPWVPPYKIKRRPPQKAASTNARV